MKILVTGGAGFIGAHLSNKLSDSGNAVFVVDNLSNGKKKKLRHEIKFFKEDITNKDFQDLIIKIKPDFIYHLAAQTSVSRSFINPRIDFQINLFATQKLIETSTKIGVEKIIFSSSAAVYSENNKIPFTENSTKTPLSIYGLTKLSSEYLFRLSLMRHNTLFACLRYSNVYGTGQDNSAEGGVVAIFISTILKGEKVIINNDGNQTRDFIHVSDVVEANIAALRSKVIGELNVSTGIETSINNLYASLIKISKKKSRKFYKPLSNPEIKNSVLSSNKFRNITKWIPKIKLREGLAETYTYFKN